MTYIREDDSIPLADGDPADFVEDSLVSEDKRKVGLVNIVFGSSTTETHNFYCRNSSGERRFGSTPIIDLLSLFKLTTNSIIVTRK